MISVATRDGDVAVDICPVAEMKAIFSGRSYRLVFRLAGATISTKRKRERPRNKLGCSSSLTAPEFSLCDKSELDKSISSASYGPRNCGTGKTARRCTFNVKHIDHLVFGFFLLEYIYNMVPSPYGRCHCNFDGLDIRVGWSPNTKTIVIGRPCRRCSTFRTTNEAAPCAP